MKTIAQVVEEIIKEQPFLEQALTEDIVNLSSLARKIKPEVEERIMKEAQSGAIVMALKRLIPTLEVFFEKKVQNILMNIGDITIRSNLSDYTFRNSDTLVERQRTLLERIHGNREAFYTISQGIYETTIVVSSSLKLVFEEIFEGEDLLSKTDKLSTITMKLPPENNSTYGVYYSIFKHIAWEGINIYEVISTTNEFSIVLKDEFVSKAFDAIKNMKQ
ncbi:MAG: aspartate kinase [Bacteroidales bacterium]|nr:aspartate kinase [Bacteroidales bacterium]